MQKVFIILLMGFPVFLFGQKSLNLGQGILKIDITQLPTLEFFSDTMEKIPLKIVTVTKDSVGEFILKGNDHVADWFSPEQLFLNYEIFMIRVDTVLGNWLLVYTNNLRPATMWVKRQPQVNFIPWTVFLHKQVSSINQDPAFKQPVKAAPNEQSPTIKEMEEADCFKIISIKGDWMNIKSNPDCSDSKKPVKSGWIRWRKKNKLIISYSLIG